MTIKELTDEMARANEVGLYNEYVEAMRYWYDSEESGDEAHENDVEYWLNERGDYEVVEI